MPKGAATTCRAIPLVQEREQSCSWAYLHGRANLERCPLKMLPKTVRGSGLVKASSSQAHNYSTLPCSLGEFLTVMRDLANEIGGNVPFPDPAPRSPHSPLSFEISPPTSGAKEQRWQSHRIERGWMPATAWKTAACQLRNLNFL